jgi:hypothetical protein
MESLTLVNTETCPQILEHRMAYETMPLRGKTSDPDLTQNSDLWKIVRVKLRGVSAVLWGVGEGCPKSRRPD